ncbi:MAG: ATP-dependent zinc metalloprotease FtsH, partial [Candidatus Methylomirabilales bacterium]
MNKDTRIPLWYLFLPLLALLIGLNLMFEQRGQQIPYSEFKQRVAAGQVEDLRISSQMVQGRIVDPEKPAEEGKAFYTIRVEDPGLVSELEERGISFVGTMETSWLRNLFIWMLPLFLVFFLLRMLYQRMGPPQGLLSVGRSKAKLYVQDETKTTFDDVAGVDEAKEELQEVVEFLRNPQKFQVLGGKIPKGVLLVGPPGTGKTLLARAVAGEAKVPFFSISGSEFVEMFVGVGAARVRDLFQQAMARAPCIVFIDELDALGKARGISPQVSHDEREQTLNQLLAEMDGFDPRKGVIIVAATNRPEILDPALLRPGRFDRQVLVDRPDVKGREAILQVHAKNVKLSPKVDLKIIAARTPGFAGADLANVMNEAALLAARRNKLDVEMGDLEEAIDRVLAGLEKKARVISAKEKEIVAYHESGHALVASSLPHTDPVHKVSIIPRGIAALGYTLQLPTEDRYLLTRSELLERLTVFLAGRCAEELIFQEVSTGAQDDLLKATDMARRMVAAYGMSERLGPVSFEQKRRPLFLPESLPAARDYAEETARAIDEEVKVLVQEACERARAILWEKQEGLHRLAKLLLDREVIEGEELREILGREETRFAGVVSE